MPGSSNLMANTKFCVEDMKDKSVTFEKQRKKQFCPKSMGRG